MSASSSNGAAPVAVVTGAARGIGLAVTRWFLARGHRVALIDIDGPTLERTATAMGHTSQVLALHCDVAMPSQVDAAIARIDEAFGRIDALVNNAGVAVFKPMLAHSAAEWQRVIDVNLTGPFLCTQACAPHMLKNSGNEKAQERGTVVNIASISGLRASSLRVAYGTSKAALIHLTKQQALELGNAGIRCNAVAPGPVETAMAKAVHSPAIRRDYHDTIPLARYGSEAEIARAVLWLCSPQASYVNGQCLAVDGGFDASGIGLVSLRNAADS